jgi:hypothetical protein
MKRKEKKRKAARGFSPRARAGKVLLAMLGWIFVALSYN